MPETGVTRCPKCANKLAYCNCPGGPKEHVVVKSEKDRRAEELRAAHELVRQDRNKDFAALDESTRSFSYDPSWEPTLRDYLMAALGFDPTQDGLYFCRGCGITWDHECGTLKSWHDDTDDIKVFLQGERPEDHECIVFIGGACIDCGKVEGSD